VHNGVTDVWLVLDGVNVRAGGAGGNAEEPDAGDDPGNLSPVDLLHLRSLRIPRFDGEA